jgi:D-glycero-alpha-D-manno-heptose-7-phosphate kinase
LRHPLVREALTLLGVTGGIEITSIADIPSRGTGLGSSSAFTVGLLNALHAYHGRHAGADQLAREACTIELERCREPIGKQDQYAAAFGGLNFMEFHPDDSVTVRPILCRPRTRQQFEEYILAFYTGRTRSASTVLQATQRAVRQKPSKRAAFRQLAVLARSFRDALQSNRLDQVGELLHEGWLLKRSLAPGISTPSIDRAYSAARRAGALGGKLLGAGAGGFLMIYAPPDRHGAVTRALRSLRRIDLKFESQGSRIIFVHP